jgi:phosphomannomutase
MATTPADPLTVARTFLAEDPDPANRRELQALVDRAAAGDAPAQTELGDRFAAPLEFGTAGLRGRVEAGVARMNRVTVAKASWGLGRHLLENAERDATRRGVVLGFDCRFSSRQFAEDAAAVLAGLGIPVHLFRDPVPTPLVAFAVPHQDAAAGVVITASHNPPADNGYKVYRADGAQILPPEAEAIAKRIGEAPDFPALLRPAPADAAANGLRLVLGDEVEAAYLAGLTSGAWHPPDPTPLRLVYTAMHGVGHRLASRALTQAGFVGVAAVPSQADPDGSFRTVPFPNPEEAGALDQALALATETGAELVLANDPDADRLAAAVALPDRAGFRSLTGDEIGVLLADDALTHAASAHRQKLVVTTLVSSSLLSRVARDRGAAYKETLTGFKWIAEAARDGEAQGQVFVFGYEEALGYTAGRLVADKDGIGAAVRLAELARHLRGQGQTLLDRLEELQLAHGMSQQTPWSVTCPGPGGRERIAGAMTALRRQPLQEIDGSPVVRILDLEAGEETLPGGGRKAIEGPRSAVLAFYAKDGGRLVVRPSGTEPKIKFYLELVAAVDTRPAVREARERLQGRGLAVKAGVLERLGLG